MSTVNLPDWFLIWGLVIAGLYVCLQVLQLIYRHILISALRDREFTNEDIKRILRFP